MSITSASVGRTDPRRPVRYSFPAGFNGWRLEPLFDPLVAEYAEARREVTRGDPLLFALLYLPHHLVMERVDPETGEPFDLVAVSEWHLDLVREARKWMTGAPSRTAWIAPRKSAKSTWIFTILTLWALAHGHRRFVLAFAAPQEQAATHLATLRTELAGNELLVRDFPDLSPTRTPGASDTARTVTRGGSAIAARGLNSTTLGMKIGATRPDLILLDDIEPDESNYSASTASKRLATLTGAILPMNEDAIVVLAGTVTMQGSITHDLVAHARGERTAPWVAETEFDAHYYPAIVDDGTPNARSLWPAMWSLRWLRDRQGPPGRRSRAFALNYMNRPELAGDNHWTHELIVGDRHFESARYVLTIDPAVTQRATSDETALAVTGVSADGRRVCVEYIYGGRMRGGELRSRVLDLARRNPTLTHARIEGNQGGERWRDILEPLPPGFTLEIATAQGAKETRIKWLVDRYVREQVVHREEFPELVEQMIAWPKGAHDDMIDVVQAGVAYHLLGTTG